MGAGQGRAGQGRAGQGRAGQDGTGNPPRRRITVADAVEVCMVMLAGL